MLSTQSLREQLNMYIGGQISADALEEWLAAESWDMERWAPVGLQRLIESVQSAFIAYCAGDIEADELDRELRGRCAQLNRAAEVSKAMLIEIEVKADESLAASEALRVVPEPAVA